MLDTINVAGISILADPDEIYGQTDYFETYVKIYIRENCPIPKIGRKEKQRATHSDNTLATWIRLPHVINGENQTCVANLAGLKSFATRIATDVKKVLEGHENGILTEPAEYALENVTSCLEHEERETFVRDVDLWDAVDLAYTFADDVTGDTSDNELVELAVTAINGMDFQDDFYFGTFKEVEAELRMMRDELVEEGKGW